MLGLKMVTRNDNVCWAVPFRFNRGGRVSKIGGSYRETPTRKDVKSAVITGMGQIIFTAPGERVLNPNFGLSVDQFLFRPVGSPGFGRLQIDIEEQLTLWEGRAIPTGISIVENPSIESNITINVSMEYTQYEGSGLTVSFGM